MPAPGSPARCFGRQRCLPECPGFAFRFSGGPSPERESRSALSWWGRVRKVGYRGPGHPVDRLLRVEHRAVPQVRADLGFRGVSPALYLIAMATSNPDTSIESMPFWRNDAEFRDSGHWRSSTGWVPTASPCSGCRTSAWVAAEVLAFSWMCDSRGPVPDERTAAWLAATGLILFTVSPWLWWSDLVRFPYGERGLAVFAVLLARDLASGGAACGGGWCRSWPAEPRRRCTCLASARRHPGLRRRYWRRGAVLIAISVAYSCSSEIGATMAHRLARHYGYLALGVSASYLTVGEAFPLGR